MMVEAGEVRKAYPGYDRDYSNLVFILGFVLWATFTLEAIPAQVREGKYVGGDIALIVFLVGVSAFFARNLIVGRNLHFTLDGEKILYVDAREQLFSSALISQIKSVKVQASRRKKGESEIVIEFGLGRSIAVRLGPEDRAEFLSELERATGKSFEVSL